MARPFDLRPALRLCGAALLALAAAAEAGEGSARLSLTTGVDTNAGRDFLAAGAQADLVGTGVLGVEGSTALDGLSAQGSYEVGGRKFFRVATEDTVVQAARGELSAQVAGPVRVGLEARGKDRRGGDKSYTDLGATAFVAFAPQPALDLRLRIGAERFLYWPVFTYSFGALELGGSARYRFDRRHAAVVFGGFAQRSYGDRARGEDDPLPGSDLPLPDHGKRSDGVWTAGAAYSYRGPFALTLSYSFFEQDSNSFGESQLRHRLALTGAVRLPWKLILLGEVGLQLARYPDGVYLSPEIQLLEDNEQQNQLSLRLVRPVGEHVDVELGYSVFYNRLPGNDLVYLRHVAGVGLVLRL